jgi:hypothetical protein
MSDIIDISGFGYYLTPLILTIHSNNVKVLGAICKTIEVTLLKGYDFLWYHGLNEFDPRKQERTSAGWLIVQVTDKYLNEIPLDTPIQLHLQDLTGHDLHTHTVLYKDINLLKLGSSSAKQNTEFYRLYESMHIDKNMIFKIIIPQTTATDTIKFNMAIDGLKLIGGKNAK